MFDPFGVAKYRRGRPIVRRFHLRL